MTEAKRPLKVFLCHAHIIPLWDADRDPVRRIRASVYHPLETDRELEIRKAVREIVS
jgi:diadenosine tetraphosphate (Ap4A) HIT family hydrolase